MSTATNGIERAPGGEIEIRSDNAPSNDHRAALERRKLELISSLTSAENVAVKRRLGRFFNLFASGAMDEETAAAIVEDYARLISSQPLWAIDQACISVIDRGETFRPGAPELLQLTRAACQNERRELADIERVLSARVYQVGTPEMRERIKEGFKTLRGKLDLESNTRKMTAEQYALLADSLAVKSRSTPMTLGPLGRKAMGIAPPEPEPEF